MAVWNCRQLSHAVTRLKDRMTYRVALTTLACLILFSPSVRGDLRQISEALTKADIRVSGLRVSEAEGIIIIRGNVQNSNQIGRAAEVVRALGYPKVAALLSVLSLADDDAIALAAERRLSFNRSMQGSHLTVRSSDGVVTIQGTVRSLFQGELAAQIVARMAGVIEVRTQLQRPGARSFRPSPAERPPAGQ